MEEKLPSFIVREGLSLKFKGEGHLAFYIPEYYFDRQYILVEGDKFSLIGLFNYAIFDSNGKAMGGLRTFKFPSMFTCLPSDMDKINNVKLNNESEPEDYRVLKFVNDDILVLSTKIPMLVDNIETFFKMLNSGKLPTTIPYKELHELFAENAELNKANYPASHQVLGMIVSEICRDKNDTNRPFRLTNDKSYTNMNVKDVPKTTSPFAAITSENFNESMVAAINDEAFKPSPLERLVIKRKRD